MRTQINKLRKGKSTKFERRFLEILKNLHIPFKTKIIIKNREADFLIGNYIIEIDGHTQNTDKNKDWIEAGYNVIHFNNSELRDIDIERIKLWEAHT